MYAIEGNGRYIFETESYGYLWGEGRASVSWYNYTNDVSHIIHITCRMMSWTTSLWILTSLNR